MRIEFGGNRKLSALALLGVFLVSSFCGVLGSTAFADSGNVGGKPAYPDPKNPRTKTIFIKTVAPSESAEDGVEVVNNTTEEKVIMVYAVDSVKSSGGAFACSQAADPIEDAGGWIKLGNKEVKLESGQKTVVKFSLTAPEDASPGEHNACIVLQEKAESTLQSGIGLNFRTAIRVAVLVPGDIIKKLVPSSIEAQTKAKDVAVTARVRSESNVSLDTNVKVMFKSLVYGNGQSQDSTFPVLRGEESEWNFDFKRPFWGGFYRASFTASYNADTTLGLGETGSGNLTEVAGPSKVVFVWPQPVALAIEILILLLLLFLLILIPKKLVARRRIKKRWVERKVRAGETVAEVAQEVGVKWKKLAKVNKLKAPYNLVAGSMIRVPAEKDPKEDIATPLPPADVEKAETKEPVEEKEEVVEKETLEEQTEDTRGLDEPNMLKEIDEPESVDEIFEDDIPEEITKEVAKSKKIAVKKKTPPKKSK